MGSSRYLSGCPDSTKGATCLRQVCVCRGCTVAKVIHQARVGLELKEPVLNCLIDLSRRLVMAPERGTSFSALALANYISGGFELCSH